MKNWFEIKAKADTKEPVEAFIFGDIGANGTPAAEFIASMQPYRERDVTVLINSLGGDVFQGYAIYNYLRGLNVTTRVVGIAASMASIVALAGKRVEMAENAFMMVHGPTGGVSGGVEDIEEYADLMKKVKGTLANTYQRKTGASSEQVDKWMSGDTWFTAKEAKAAGLVDAITDEVSFSAHADLSKFSNVPKALTEPPVDSTTKDVNQNPDTQKTFIESLKALLGIAPAQPAAPVEPEAKVDPELIQARADLTTAKQTIGTLEAKVKELETSVATITAQAKADVEAATKQASIKAAQITSAQGQPPLDVKPTDTPAATKHVNNLKGFDAVVAAINQQINPR